MKCRNHFVKRIPAALYPHLYSISLHPIDTKK